MKICGCEDAEKGYVIINPDSPDRRQILSLNPPICREIISNSLDIDGEIYIFKKEIEDWTITPLPSGIEVDWGGLGTDIIEGTSSNTTQGQGWTEVWRGFPPLQFTCIGNILRGYSKTFVTAGTHRTFIINPNTGGISRGGNQTVIQSLRVEYHAGATAPDCTGRTFSVPTSRFQSLGGGGNWNNLSTNSQGTNGWAVYGVERFSSNWYKVTSNIGDISYRATNTPPSVSLISSGCELVVNYSDGSESPLVELSQCPQNIKKIESLEISDTGGILQQISPAPSGEIVFQCGERECPPETCFNCDCSELNCCYDENGKLIDSFIRRT